MQIDLFAELNCTRAGIFNDANFLPGIALHQPYSGLVRLGIKDLETRMNRCHNRGTVVICATYTVVADVLIKQREQLVPSRVSASVFDAAISLAACVVALAELVDCRLLTKADEPRSRFWSDDDAGKRYAWELKDIRPLVPRRVRCMPGWFPVPRGIVQVAA